MTLPLSEFQWQSDAPRTETGLELDDAGHTEWLETDGCGGFACSSVTMTPARRYHGLLVAPRPGTATRHVFLAGLLEEVQAGGDARALSTVRLEGDPPARWPAHLRSFGLCPWPRAVLAHGPYEIQREIIMVRGRPAVLVRYSLTAADADADTTGGVTLRLRPLTAYREADTLTIHNDVLRRDVDSLPAGIRCQPYDSLPPMAITLETTKHGSVDFQPDAGWIHGVEYDTDLARGYESREDLFSPGTFEVQLQVGESVVFAATIGDEIEAPAPLWTKEAKRRRAALPKETDLQGRCAVAADDFLYEGPGARTGVLAGFPWFGEWGRDTFIALPGLTLARGNLKACAQVLSGARAYLQDGLLPNIFGSTIETSHYGSVDASLWFARAVLLYERAGGGAQRIKREYLPALIEIATHYREGTAAGIQALGIHGDEGGLIVAGSPTLNPTWMDANAGGVAVTPRHGCAVEICALWYSLLAHLAELTADETKAHKAWKAAANKARKTFLQRFWLEGQGHLADVWRPDEVDTSIRPNMVLAAALELSPLSKSKRASILAVAERELLTPYGLRTLSPGDRHYTGYYIGGPEQRDSAYHQGTVWPWLLGFFCEASLRVDGTKRNRAHLRTLWDAFLPHLDSGGLGHIAEVFDGDAPHHPGGTFAQAWNTAELLRAFALIDGELPLTRRRSS
jgi:predicted glycogen debranching enzyme